MPTFIEIVQVSSSETLRADPSLAQPAIDYLTKVDGCLSIRQGFQVEDPTKAFLVINWESLDKPKQMQQRADFPSFLSAMQALGTLDNLRFLEFDADTSNAFSAAVTEITTIKAKEAEGHTLDDVAAVVARIRENEHLAKGGRPPIAWARQSVQEGEVGVLVIGWDSVEDHLAAYTGPPFDATTRELIALSEPATIHVVLQ
ncbi:hypothetical protein D9619_006946 [Psilocybe cf. subviscida]|uniref:ABM domain-containing protein n=1 Tax=Psilocybe cf. subviscida TaxID=2480587 RepID=A0A8H5B396_9AGAR|nr:hypothetical protein D9619_006946 [Psilocybe cf. subviscida]